jgi:predicted dehydrogenase
MVERELALPQSERIHFVSIVTPNDLHCPVATVFLNAGFHIVCDKPMTRTVAEARSLKQTVRTSRRVFALTHNYTGYPMVKLARDMVAQGDLGALRKVVVEYPQGWLARRLEATGMKQAAWRTDPARSGGSGCMGDIGTHAANLAEYITGLRIVDVCADLTTFVKGRRLDDDGNVLLRFQKGVRGVLHASQVSVGEDNALSIRVYGERQGLEWRQEEPNVLDVKPDGAPLQRWSRGHDYVAEKSPAAARASRLPAGHPEGFHEAFANVYRNATDTIRARLSRTRPDPLALDFPTVDDGVRGMLLVEALLKSARSTRRWTRVPSR